MIIRGNELIPDEGMTLTNGETYSKHVFLGKWDSVENWREIPDEDVPEPSEETIEDKAEAYDILMGVEQ